MGVKTVTKHSVISHYGWKKNSWIKRKPFSLCSNHILCLHCSKI